MMLKSEADLFAGDDLSNYQSKFLLLDENVGCVANKESKCQDDLSVHFSFDDCQKLVPFLCMD